MIKNRKQVISFTAEPDLIDYLNEMSVKEHVTVSQYIRNVLWLGKMLKDSREAQEAVTPKVTTKVDLDNPF